MSARIVPLSEREAVEDSTPTREEQAELLQHLLQGEMVHFDDLRSHFNGAAIRRQYRVRLRTRNDGEGGRYYWTEPLHPSAP